MEFDMWILEVVSNLRTFHFGMLQMWYLFNKKHTLIFKCCWLSRQSYIIQNSLKVVSSKNRVPQFSVSHTQWPEKKPQHFAVHCAFRPWGSAGSNTLNAIWTSNIFKLWLTYQDITSLKVKVYLHMYWKFKWTINFIFKLYTKMTKMH